MYAKVKARLEYANNTDCSTQIWMVCSAPELFLDYIGISDENYLLKWSAPSVITYLISEHLKINYYHPVIKQLEILCSKYTGHAFKDKQFIADFVKGAEELLAKFDNLFIEETGIAYGKGV